MSVGSRSTREAGTGRLYALQATDRHLLRCIPHCVPSNGGAQPALNRCAETFDQSLRLPISYPFEFVQRHFIFDVPRV